MAAKGRAVSEIIHYTAQPLMGLPPDWTAWREGACGARVDKVFTQEWPPGKRTIHDVTCGNCRRTRVFKKACETTMEGPVHKDILDRFTKYLSKLTKRTMELDPYSAGWTIWNKEFARYQWKVKRGRSSDHQGIVLKVTQQPEIWIVRSNRVRVVISLHEFYYFDIADGILNRTKELLSPAWGPVLEEQMAPYKESYE